MADSSRRLINLISTILDLSKMDFSEVYAEFTDAARLPDELQAATEIQQKIEDYYARASQ